MPPVTPKPAGQKPITPSKFASGFRAVMEASLEHPPVLVLSDAAQNDLKLAIDAIFERKEWDIDDMLDLASMAYAQAMVLFLTSDEEEPDEKESDDEESEDEGEE